jgi:hypothetical protein
MISKIPSRSLWPALAWCVLAFAFGLAVYRAKTQPIAHDEALIYEWFLDGGVGHVLVYNPGNHVLFTLLAKPIVWALGVHEITLRAPSLLGTAMFLFATYFLCRRLFGEGLMLLLSVVMLCLNPQVMDFMLAARGYILGFAFLFAAMHVLAGLAERGPFQPDDRQWRQGCAVASIFLAFSVAANFTNIVPAASLMLTFAAVVLGGFPALIKFRARTVQIFAQYFVLPGIAIGFSILWPFLIQVRLVQLEINMHRASDAVRNAFEASFLYRWTGDIYAPSLGAVAPSLGSWQARISNLGVYLFFPLLLSFVAFGLILASRRSAESRSDQYAHCMIFAGAAIASIVFIVVLHVVAKVDYPLSRYCLFVIPLFTISSLLIAREVYSRFPRSYLKGAGLLIAALVVFDYALSLHTTYFRYNAYDVISLDLYQAIANDARAHGLTTVRVGGTWWYEPEINFYRRRYHATWMMPYDVKDPSSTWQTPNALQPAEYNYFLFTAANDPGLTGPRVRTIFSDSFMGVTVAAIDKY